MEQRNRPTKPQSIRSRPQTCRYFTQPGGCRFGASCKFLHVTNGTNEAIRDNNDTKGGHGHRGDTKRDKMIRWRYAIPRIPGQAQPLGPQLSSFIRTALDLIDTDPGVMQDVILALSSEGGFVRLKELLDRDFDSMSNLISQQVVCDQLIPFFKILTHVNVATSIMLEDNVGSIYNFLYSRQGDRGIKTFTLITRVLESSSEPVSYSTAPLESILATFSNMIEMNSHALTNDRLAPLADRIFAICNNLDNASTLQLNRTIAKIRRRLGVGQRLELVERGAKAPAAQATFILSQDLPGMLSPNETRHDNDHAHIKDIQVLPTFAEIKSVRQPYLPAQDPGQWHLSGIQGLLDRHFRLLREDTVGQLRDAVAAEIEQIQMPNKSAARIFTYDNLLVTEMRFSRWKGLQLCVRIDQPRNLSKSTLQARREWWESTKRLQIEAVVCIISQQDSVTFCTVSELSHKFTNNTKSNAQDLGKDKNMYNDNRYCHLQLQIVEPDANAISDLLKHVHKADTSHKLVEFPGVLLPAFLPTLEALKKMSTQSDLPFAEHLIPGDAGRLRQPEPSPPLYASKPGFQFDLRDIMKDKSSTMFSLHQAFNIEKFKAGTILDNAQADALLESLKRSLALIQGPPGTGKSFTGVALIKVLLAVKTEGRLGPILCVCYTNHALDQLLEHLVHHGVTQIIRMGSRSKSEILENCNLREVAKHMQVTGPEKRKKWEIVKQLQAEENQIDELLAALSRPTDAQAIQDYLAVHHPNHHNQLFDSEDLDADGFRTVHYNQGNEIREWLGGRRGQNSWLENVRSLQILKYGRLDDMNHNERKKLHNHWLKDMRELLQERLIVAIQSHRSQKTKHDSLQHELDLRCLQDANIIGITTTGLARQLDLLRNLRAKVLICEEAGEVLEAHILTALLPSLEHAVLIGDHLQLPPHIQNYELSRENHQGEHYSLDVSLFERLVVSLNFNTSLPLSILETQRRMHPSISKLIRSTLYPQLKDSPHVEEYPSVAGMKRRLFWLDHRESEAGSDPARLNTTSHSNDFEIKMVIALITHLVRQGVYATNEIAVLTPYLGQLLKIRKELRHQFEITLNERDAEEIERQGLVDDNDSVSKSVPVVGKQALLKTLAISTIDNFQGEEAKVVVISLVRSNPQNRCGFLKTSNRINVLLSRAKHGMYIIGNSETSRHVKMWADVISMLDKEGNFGRTLELECSRHPEIAITVSKPDDFVIFSPEGGCNKKCDKRLDCGHRDQSKCHSEALHKAVKCLEPCPRQLKGCDHPCPKLCGEKCITDCQVVLTGLSVELSCGHIKVSLPCWQTRNTGAIKCRTAVEKIVSGCGHKVTVACNVDTSSSNFVCTAACGARLECGHACQSTCNKCNDRVDGALIAQNHGSCRLECGKKFNSCSHYCRLACHGDTPCECRARCENFCEHSRCGKSCGEPCAPCAETVCASGRCPHTAPCSMPCSAPCDWLPCSVRCEKLLTCGHQCPTVCGETCPSLRYCQICANKDTKSIMVDFILGSTYEDVDLDDDPVIIPACGHILTISSMDGQMEMSKHYVMDGNVALQIRNHSLPFSMDELKVCATCRGSLRNIARYGRIVRRALLDESTKKFIRWSGLKTIVLTQAFHDKQEKLSAGLEGAQKTESKIKNTHKIRMEGTMSHQLDTIKNEAPKRYKDLIALRTAIQQHTARVKVDEQPFKQVWNFVQHAKRSRDNVGHMEFDTSVLLTRETVQLTALSMRCDLAVLSDFLALMQTRDIAVNFASNKACCKDLVRIAIQANQPLHVAEGYMFYAQFCAAERQFMVANEVGELINDARHHIAQAKNVCRTNPGSTSRIVTEVEEVEKMLRNSTFYVPMRDSEWRDVMAAMAGEFRGGGHWYRCQNGHPFTVGDCGMPMQLARCPQCDAPVGGQNHRAAPGVSHADDLERQFGNVQL